MDFPDIDSQGGVSQGLSAKEEAWHAEQRRRSNDVIRVSNPTNEDFFVKWESQLHRFPANSTKDVPRYIATTYCRDMKVKLIDSENQKKHDEFLAERRKKGFADFTSKYEENQETYMTQSYPRTDDFKLATKIYDELWVGVVYEFGKDEFVNKDPRSGEVDITPDEVKILRSLNNRKVSDVIPEVQEPSESIVESFESRKPGRPSKKELEKEITND